MFQPAFSVRPATQQLTSLSYEMTGGWLRAHPLETVFVEIVPVQRSTLW